MTHARGALKSAIIAAIRALTDQLGHPPSVREISAHTGSTGIGHVHAALLELRTAGVVTWEDNQPRTIRLVREGPPLAQMALWSDAEIARVEADLRRIKLTRAGRKVAA